MALIHCRECGTQISSHGVCPKCGHIRDTGHVVAMWVVGIISTIIAIIWLFAKWQTYK